MNISVVLCTYNRHETLNKALDSLAASIVPAEWDWEVLVVDNNSNDQTREVAQSFCRQHPGRFRYLFDPRPGKSYALNTGIQEARGEILAFTDDDVTVDPAWLQNLTSELHNGEWSGAGGRTLPERDFVAPGWLSPAGNTLAPLGCFDAGLQHLELTEPPYGNNMAFRREVFEKYGGFRTDLGPRPGSEIRSEDTEFGFRLLSGGEYLRYEPSAVLYHAIPLRRIRQGYFLTWWFDKARGETRASGCELKPKWTIAGIPLALFGRLSVWTLRWLFVSNPSVRFSNKVNVWYISGQILECYHQSLTRKQQAKNHPLVSNG